MPGREYVAVMFLPAVEEILDKTGQRLPRQHRRPMGTWLRPQPIAHDPITPSGKDLVVGQFECRVSTRSGHSMPPIPLLGAGRERNGQLGSRGSEEINLGLAFAPEALAIQSKMDPTTSQC